MLALVLILLVCAWLRMSTTCIPWYIAYVYWFLYLLPYESEAVSLEKGVFQKLSILTTLCLGFERIFSDEIIENFDCPKSYFYH